MRYFILGALAALVLEDARRDWRDKRHGWKLTVAISVVLAVWATLTVWTETH